MNSKFHGAVLRTGAAVVTSALLLVTPAATSFTAMAAEDTGTAVQSVMASGINMSTDYPGISVQAGDSISFDLDFTNSGTGELVDLSASGLPDGFEGYFQGNGHQVSSVYVKNGESDSLVTYNITVPDTAEDGEYKITLKADGTSHSSTLVLNLTVSELDLGASTLTTEYDNQSGSAGDTVSFDTTLANNSVNDQTFTLSADAPEGWSVTYKTSDSSNITSVNVDGASSETVTVTIQAPNDAAAQDYTIPIHAVSEEGDDLELDLKVTITGSYDLSFTTQNETLSFDAKANTRNSIVMEITNNGNAPLTNINLTSSAPTDWTVEFSESTIDSLDAGASKEVTAYVTPAESAISGDYSLTMTATAEETSTSNAFRVTVQTQTVWGIVGIVIIAAIIGCLVAVFHKFGRH